MLISILMLVTSQRQFHQAQSKNILDGSNLCTMAFHGYLLFVMSLRLVANLLALGETLRLA